MNNGNPEREKLGREIYATNMAIHLGKEAVRSVIANKPVDEIVLSEEREKLHALRLGRNALLQQLNPIRTAADYSGMTTWLR